MCRSQILFYNMKGHNLKKGALNILRVYCTTTIFEADQKRQKMLPDGPYWLYSLSVSSEHDNSISCLFL